MPMKRQFPDIKFLSSLIVWRVPFVHRRARAIAAAASVADLALLAKKKVPLSVFDYVDGSALDEIGRQKRSAIYWRIADRYHVGDRRTFRNVVEYLFKTDL